MAIQQWVVDRYKAKGFYRHVEWSRSRGVLVKVYEADQGGHVKVTFESGTFDIEYDQRFAAYRQFYRYRTEAVKMMLNMGFNLQKIAKVFRQIDGMQVVTEYVK